MLVICPAAVELDAAVSELDSQDATASEMTTAAAQNAAGATTMWTTTFHLARSAVWLA